MHHTTLVSILHTLALTTIVTTAVGCSGYAEKENEGSTAQRIVSNNARTAFQFFVRRGLSEVQAAAIVGNLQKESTANITPGIAQPGGRGRGIAQWSTGDRWDTTSRDNLRWYAAQHHQSMTSLDAQLGFIWYELETFPSAYHLPQLRAAQTIESAVSAFEHGFERCGTCDEPRRVQYARSALTAFGNGASSSSSPSDSSAGKSGSDDGSNDTSTDTTDTGTSDKGAPPDDSSSDDSSSGDPDKGAKNK